MLLPSCERVIRSVRVPPLTLQTIFTVSPAQLHLPRDPLAGCIAAPAFSNITSDTPRYHDHVPTILLQERPDGVSCVFAADRFGTGLSASPPPDMDLSCLPIVPPTLPAWASAVEALTNAKCEIASVIMPIDARRLMLAP